MSNSDKVIKIRNPNGTLTTVKKKPKYVPKQYEVSLNIKRDRIYTDKEMQRIHYRKTAKLSEKQRPEQTLGYSVEHVTKCGNCRNYAQTGCILNLGRSMQCIEFKVRG